jgi:hypoxanthine phosphoribosyltransferase
MKISVDDKDFELLLEYDQIKKRTRFLGIQINMDYEDKTPLFIGVLNGSFIFMADLIKEIQISSEITFIKVSSYKGDTSTGDVKEVLGLDLDLKGREIIVVEDIIDTGLTLNSVLATIKQQQPASIAVCTLLYKPQAIKEEIEELAYVGFEIPNEFVVGYGLDYNGLGRNLKDIYRAIPLASET